jgi:hypothetical protein
MDRVPLFVFATVVAVIDPLVRCLPWWPAIFSKSGPNHKKQRQRSTSRQWLATYLVGKNIASP